jgi:hypothetical protein
VQQRTPELQQRLPTRAFRGLAVVLERVDADEQIEVVLRCTAAQRLGRSAQALLFAAEAARTRILLCLEKLVVARMRLTSAWNMSFHLPPLVSPHRGREARGTHGADVRRFRRGRVTGCATVSLSRCGADVPARLPR